MRKAATPVVVEKKQKVVEEAPVQDKKPAGWDGGRIVWGLVPIAIGVLFLLETFGVVTLNFAALWQLWPLLIIMAGISMLALKGWVSVVVSLIATVLIVGLATLVLTGAVDVAGERRSEEFSVAQQQVDLKYAEVEIKTGAATLNIADHDSDEVAIGTLESNSAQLEQDVTVENGVQRVALTMDSRDWWRTNRQSDLAVQLTRNLPVALRIDAGAANIRADLSRVIASSVRVDSGASKVWLKLGDKQQVSSVSLKTGASSVEILVPKSTGVLVQIDSGLSSEQLPSDLLRVGEKTYESPGYEQQDRKISIVIDMGISHFKLTRY